MKDITDKRLHEHLKASVQGFSSPAESKALRALIEATGAENFLTGLLFLQLHGTGYKVSRELPLEKRRAADIAVHGSSDSYIEAKQLHLKDGCKYAPENLKKDLKRHSGVRSLGIIYIADERSSTTSRHKPRFKDANRNRKKAGVPVVLEELNEFFRVVYPKSASKGLLRKFAGQGGVSLYAFVVQL